ncbi:MAG: redox-sensing transcriptional repressor Rex [Candidatus Hydrogenedens sp.]|jgi:redox-sensing transcriptional repressor|nr:redox-sensing transcriptional repressor Rex [Candidatus Hydrogenedens sp.]
MSVEREISPRTIERLSLYRRLLLPHHEGEDSYIFSHDLAELAGVTATQVRRDFMQLGCMGVPRTGYRIGELLSGISGILDAPAGQRAALVGVGHLGAALLNHFSGRWRWLHIHAAFDRDPDKAGSVIHGCHCFPMSELSTLIRERKIDLGIITVPRDHAQEVANQLIEAGVQGLLNFAPIRLRHGDDIYVENVDLTSAFETVAYFARCRRPSLFISESHRGFPSLDDRKLRGDDVKS